MEKLELILDKNVGNHMCLFGRNQHYLMIQNNFRIVRQLATFRSNFCPINWNRSIEDYDGDHG